MTDRAARLTGDPAPADLHSANRWALALAAIEIITERLPEGTPALGGILLRARPGPVRDAWAACPPVPMRKRSMAGST